MQASCAWQFGTHRVDKQHALHNVPEAGAAGIRQGVIHSLHDCLKEATLVLRLEGQLPLYSRQDSSRNADHADCGVTEPVLLVSPTFACCALLRPADMPV